MLKIGKNKFFFDGDEVKKDSINFSEFIIANLDSEVELEDGLTIEDMVHFFYESREFIYAYFSQHYEVLRAFLMIKNFHKQYSAISIGKKMNINEGYITFIPSVDFIKINPGEKGYNELSKIPIILNEIVSLLEEDIFSFEESRVLKQVLKSKVTLIDIMRALFEDLVSLLEENLFNL